MYHHQKSVLWPACSSLFFSCRSCVCAWLFRLARCVGAHVASTGCWGSLNRMPSRYVTDKLRRLRCIPPPRMVDSWAPRGHHPGMISKIHHTLGWYCGRLRARDSGGVTSLGCERGDVYMLSASEDMPIRHAFETPIHVLCCLCFSRFLQDDPSN